MIEKEDYTKGDVIESLTFTFKNTKPVDAKGFIAMMQGVQSLYEEILEKQEEFNENDIKLCIKFRKGSERVIFDVIGKIEDVRTTYSILKSIFIYIANDIEDTDYEGKLKKDKEITNKISRLLNADPDGKMEISHEDKKTSEKKEMILANDGSRIKKVTYITREVVTTVIEEYEGDTSFEYEEMLLSFTKSMALRAKISSISNKKVPITCDNDIMNQLMEANRGNPLSTVFIVSGEKITKDGRIIKYHISEVEFPAPLSLPS